MLTTGSQSLSSAEAMMSTAVRLYREGLVGEAESTCRTLLWQFPAHTAALSLTGRIARDSARLSEAGELFRRLVSAAPKDAVALAELGALEVALGRPQEALLHLERAIAIEPRSRAHADLAAALLILGRLDEAEAACLRMLQLHPHEPPAYITLAECQRQRGMPEKARLTLESARRLVPNSVSVQIALADVESATGEFHLAVPRYRRVIASTTQSARIHSKLAAVLKAMGDLTGAVEALQCAVAEKHSAPEGHQLLAQMLLECGRIPESIASVHQALRLKSDYPAARLLLAAAVAAGGEVDEAAEALRTQGGGSRSPGECLTGIANHLIESGHLQPAVRCLRRRLELQPEDAPTRHSIAALTGLNPESAPPEYVKGLFDSYADSFDKSLLRGLGYAVPRGLAEAVAASPGQIAPPWDVLDLGCGTGLVGAEFAPHARRLVGVDISTNMVRRSQERHLYTRLVCADLLEMLQAEPAASFDVVTAGDVFIYVGKLDEVVPAVRRLIRPGGLFAFSAEALTTDSSAAGTAGGAGYWLHTRARYAHRMEYLQGQAALNGFDIRSVRDIRLRFERGRPVPGWLMVWSA
jgi:predicted TPR repeat methyltransferase/predicted Zn-dependent protease